MNTATFKHSLETGSKKHRCPDCGLKTFVRYIDSDSKEYLPDEIGRCDRESSCGYHLTPKQYNAEHDIKRDNSDFAKVRTAQNSAVLPVPINFITQSFVHKSMAGYDDSSFAKFIIALFGITAGKDLLTKYFIGRSKLNNGKANIFWRIDLEGNVRTGKIMAYNEPTGKRNKEINPTWVHALKDQNKNPLFPKFNFELCFFGEHFISEFPGKPIAICESEKTALIASFFMPQFNWLATGGASGCKWREYSVYKVLKNKEIILFPDFGYFNKKTDKTCYQEWQERAIAIMDRMNCSIKVSRVLENNIPEDQRVNDIDLVDLLIKRDPATNTGPAVTDEGYPAIFDHDFGINEMDLSFYEHN